MVVLIREAERPTKWVRSAVETDPVALEMDIYDNHL
jgi:hypothetical protein